MERYSRFDREQFNTMWMEQVRRERAAERREKERREPKEELDMRSIDQWCLEYFGRRV